MKRPALVLLAVALSLGAAFAGEAEDRAAIDAASRNFSAAFVAGDTAAIRELYTKDAVLLPPGREIHGRDAIARFFAPNPLRTQLAHAMTSEDLRIHGDMAIDSGTWSNTFRGADGEQYSASERYLVIWRRATDGAWQIEYDMWHRPAPSN